MLSGNVHRICWPKCAAIFLRPSPASNAAGLFKDEGVVHMHFMVRPRDYLRSVSRVSEYEFFILPASPAAGAMCPVCVYQSRHARARR